MTFKLCQSAHLCHDTEMPRCLFILHRSRERELSVSHAVRLEQQGFAQQMFQGCCLYSPMFKSSMCRDSCQQLSVGLHIAVLEFTVCWPCCWVRARSVCPQPQAFRLSAAIFCYDKPCEMFSIRKRSGTVFLLGILSLIRLMCKMFRI